MALMISNWFSFKTLKIEEKKDYKLIHHKLVYHIQDVLSPTKYAAADLLKMAI